MATDRTGEPAERAAVAPQGRNAAWRLFVAVELPPAWRAWLAEGAARLERLAPRYARWVAPDLFHLTVVFLGEQPVARLPAIEEALAAATRATTPFDLAPGRLGRFGGDRPSVLFVEAKAPPGTLDRLHARLAQALQERAVPFEAKPLVAHLTLGRARRDADPAVGRTLARQLPAVTLPAPPSPFTVGELTLMRSELQAAGPRYTAIGHWLLGPADQ